MPDNNTDESTHVQPNLVWRTLYNVMRICYNEQHLLVHLGRVDSEMDVPSSFPAVHDKFPTAKPESADNGIPQKSGLSSTELNKKECSGLRELRLNLR